MKVGPSYLIISLLFVCHCIDGSPKSISKRDDEADVKVKRHEMADRIHLLKDPVLNVGYAFSALASASTSPYNALYKFQELLGVLGPSVLGVSIGLSVVAAFLPKSDSPMLAQMKENFDTVITGFTRIESKVGELEQVVVHENTKTAFGEYQRNILNLYEDWNYTVNAKTAHQEQRNRAFFMKQYELHYKKGAMNLFRSMVGLFDGELNNDLLKVASERYKCDGFKIRKLCTAVTQTILQGLALEGAYYTYMELFDRIENEEKLWKERLGVLHDKCEETIEKCSDRWKEFALPLINKIYEENKKSSHEILAEQVYQALASNVGQRAWFVFAYDLANGFDSHGFAARYESIGADAQTRWRENKKMFAVISWDMDKYPSFQQDLAKKGLDEARQTIVYCRPKPPGFQDKEPAKSMITLVTEESQNASMVVYAVKSNLNLGFRGTPGHYLNSSVKVPKICKHYPDINFELFALG